MKRPAGLAGLTVAALTVASVALASPDVWKHQGWAKTDFRSAAVDLSEIVSGGPPKDGIPSIDDPKFRSAAAVSGVGDREPVIRLEIEGDLRAYPLQVLTWHEIVNDNVGGVPVAVTYCPLCNAAIVFERVVAGEPTTFGTTGKLRNSDLVMYDRKTESWWQQFTGEAIVGEMTGTTLHMRPARIVSFADFKAEAPQGRVLIPDNPTLPRYGRNPYVGYDTRALPGLYRGDLPEGIEPMARVVVVRTGEQPQAVSLQLLRESGEVSLGDVTLTWREGVSSALDTARIADGREVGAVRAVRSSDTGAMIDVVHDVTFAFAVHAFHPDLDIMTGE